MSWAYLPPPLWDHAFRQDICLHFVAGNQIGIVLIGELDFSVLPRGGATGFLALVGLRSQIGDPGKTIKGNNKQKY